jgi:hypothetical protein
MPRGPLPRLHAKSRHEQHPVACDRLAERPRLDTRDEGVDGEDKLFVHRANGTTTRAGEIALRRRVAPYYGFATRPHSVADSNNLINKIRDFWRPTLNPLAMRSILRVRFNLAHGRATSRTRARTGAEVVRALRAGSVAGMLERQTGATRRFKARLSRFP